jgi:LacI family repressor for deo operon, udp, cdd, tsx, nupC, and nupG
MAIGAQQAIHEAGLNVPQDIAIVGFDDLRFGAFASPP